MDRIEKTRIYILRSVHQIQQSLQYVFTHFTRRNVQKDANNANKEIDIPITVM